MTPKNNSEFSTETLQILAEELEEKLRELAVYQDYLRVQRLLTERRGSPVRVDAVEKGLDLMVVPLDASYVGLSFGL